MKNLIYLTAILFLFACKESVDPNVEEWISLFNGKDLNGWSVKTQYTAEKSKTSRPTLRRRKCDSSTCPSTIKYQMSRGVCVNTDGRAFI